MGRSSAAARCGGATSTVIVVILGAVVVIVVGLGFLGMWGLDVFAEQVKEKIQDNPVVLKHIGKIESIEWDVTATAAADAEETHVFDLEGSKGNGVLTVDLRIGDERIDAITAGSLRLPGGEKVDLFPERAPAPERTEPAPPEVPERETR